jgi:predicted N-acyltransferase
VHPDDLFHSAAWLGLENDRADRPPRYFFAGRPNGPAEAALACYPLDAASEPWPFMRVDRTLWHLANRYSLTVPDRVAAILPTYLCGSRRSPDTRLMTRPGCPEARRRELAADIVVAVEAEASERAMASVSFLFVGENDRALRDTLTRRGYTEFPTARYATLHLAGPGFDAYLDTLSSGRRREVRRERRRLADAGIRFAVEPFTPALMAELAPLQLQHGRKYGHAYTLDGLTRGGALFAKHCGAAMRAVTARSADGVVRGFAMVAVRGERLFVLQTGYDYRWQGKLPVYFAVVYYEPVEYASRIGAVTLDYAIESETTKLSRGCVLERRHGYLKVFDTETHHEVSDFLAQVRRAGR